MIKSTHRHWLGALSMTTMLVAPLGVAAQQVQPAIGNGTWYYRIGGGAPIPPAPNVNAIAITLDGSAALTMPRACGSLDPTIAISNTLGNVADGVDRLDDLLVASATEAIAALPAIILQRANPGLYEHFQTALSSAKQTYDLSVRSCEQIVEDFSDGKNPLSDWVLGAKRETWQLALADEDADSVAAVRDVDEANGNLGRTWIGGEKGAGLDQPAIEVNRQVPEAAYNLRVNRDVTAEGAPPESDERLAKLFPTPKDVGDFSVQVLGSESVTICDGCTPSTTAGTGLLTAYDLESRTIEEALLELTEGTGPISFAATEEISAAEIVITPSLIDVLRNIPDAQTRVGFIGNFASGVAIARTVEKAQTLQQLLYSGRKIPEVAAEPLAMAALDVALAELDQQIDWFYDGIRLQKELVGETALEIFREAERLAVSASGSPDSRRQGGGVFLRGEVQDD